MNRADIAELIIAQLSRHKHELNQTFSAPTPAIKCGYIDHLLPEQLCEQIYHAFPDNRSMKSYLALRDYKFVAAHIPRYDAIIEETAAAFQDPQVRQLLADITGIHNQPPLSHLNSSGLLTLHPQQFIAPPPAGPPRCRQPPLASAGTALFRQPGLASRTRRLSGILAGRPSQPSPTYRAAPQPAGFDHYTIKQLASRQPDTP